MENNKRNEDSGWFDGLLQQPQVGDEIGVDEHAVHAAGLGNIRDMELEKILQETPAEEPQPETDEEILPEEPDAQEPDDEIIDLSAPKYVARKVRPRRKKGYGLFGLPHIASIAIWAGLVLFIGISLGRFLWLCATDILGFGKQEQIITVTITENDDVPAIAQKLHHAGLIKYPGLFEMYAELTGGREDISNGTFELNSLFDYHALVNGMSSGSSYRESKEVVIPEGYSCAQIFALLEKEGICTVAELEKYAMENEFASYWFLEGVEKGHKYTLEGYLFPDTYQFYTNATAKHVFQKMLGRFEDLLDEELQAHLITLNEQLTAMYKRNGYDQSYIDEHLMTMQDVIIVASMIEKESAHTGENYKVSSVIYNRLTNQRNFPYLQIDATIVYALGGKADLTAEDLKLDSPYNTYLYGGLPPTPIANPGLSAIMAALRPEETNFHYYALNPATGEHKFSETLKQHQDFLASLR